MNTNQTIIHIPDNLSPQKENDLIINILQKKFITESKGKTKRIGEHKNVDSFKFAETNIKIIRTPTEKAKKTAPCSCCNTVYVVADGVKYYSNYGGFAKLKKVCSENCRDFILETFIGRTFKTKPKNSFLF